MKISQEGIDLITKFEGFSATAYQCPAGVWTIGYGTTNGVKKGDKVTKERAEKLLFHDVAVVEDHINKVVGCDLRQNEFDALCSLVYNIGCGAFSKSTLLKKINSGNHNEVPAQFMRWNKAGGKVSNGLTRRRQAEADLWMKSSSDTAVAMPQAVDSPDKPLFKSRTMAGASITAAATAAQETSKQIEPLIPYAESLKLLFVFLALAGIAITVYARWDDKRKGSL